MRRNQLVLAKEIVLEFKDARRDLKTLIQKLLNNVEKLRNKEIDLIEIQETINMMLYLNQLGVKFDLLKKIKNARQLDYVVDQLVDKIQTLFGGFPKFTIYDIKIVKGNEIENYARQGYQLIDTIFNKSVDIYSNMPIVNIFLAEDDNSEATRKEETVAGYIHPVLELELADIISGQDLEVNIDELDIDLKKKIAKYLVGYEQIRRNGTVGVSLTDFLIFTHYGLVFLRKADVEFYKELIRAIGRNSRLAKLVYWNKFSPADLEIAKQYPFIHQNILEQLKFIQTDDLDGIKRKIRVVIDDKLINLAQDVAFFEKEGLEHGQSVEIDKNVQTEFIKGVGRLYKSYGYSDLYYLTPNDILMAGVGPKLSQIYDDFISYLKDNLSLFFYGVYTYNLYNSFFNKITKLGFVVNSQWEELEFYKWFVNRYGGGGSPNFDQMLKTYKEEVETEEYRTQIKKALFVEIPADLDFERLYSTVIQAITNPNSNLYKLFVGEIDPEVFDYRNLEIYPLVREYVQNKNINQILEDYRKFKGNPLVMNNVWLKTNLWWWRGYPKFQITTEDIGSFINFFRFVFRLWSASKFKAYKNETITVKTIGNIRIDQKKYAFDVFKHHAKKFLEQRPPSADQLKEWFKTKYLNKYQRIYDHIKQLYRLYVETPANQVRALTYITNWYEIMELFFDIAFYEVGQLSAKEWFKVESEKIEKVVWWELPPQVRVNVYHRFRNFDFLKKHNDFTYWVLEQTPARVDDYPFTPNLKLNFIKQLEQTIETTSKIGLSFSTPPAYLFNELAIGGKEADMLSIVSIHGGGSQIFNLFSIDPDRQTIQMFDEDYMEWREVNLKDILQKVRPYSYNLITFTYLAIFLFDGIKRLERITPAQWKKYKTAENVNISKQYSTNILIPNITDEFIDALAKRIPNHRQNILNTKKEVNKLLADIQKYAELLDTAVIGGFLYNFPMVFKLLGRAFYSPNQYIFLKYSKYNLITESNISSLAKTKIDKLFKLVVRLMDKLEYLKTLQKQYRIDNQKVRGFNNLYKSVSTLKRLLDATLRAFQH